MRCYKIRKRVLSISLGISILVLLLFTFAYGADVTTTASVANSVPVASGAQLNGGMDMTLIENQSTTVQGTVTVTDSNGCTEIDNVTATLFRTNVAGGSSAPENNRSHYSTLCTSNGDCVGGPDMVETFTCDFDLLWYADATDAGSFYQATDWTFNATPTDGSGGVSDTAQQEVDTLTSIVVLTSSISFGQLALSSDTGALNQNTTLANLGNENLDIQIKGYGIGEGDGYCMACTVGEVDVDMLEFNDVSFTYGFGQDLGSLDEELDLDLDRGNDTISRPEKLVYYGLGFPATGIGGTCSGTIAITAESDPTFD